MNAAHDVPKGTAVQRPRFNHAVLTFESDSNVGGLSTIGPSSANTCLSLLPWNFPVTGH
jgi:hypothetical protein